MILKLSKKHRFSTSDAFFALSYLAWDLKLKN